MDLVYALRILNCVLSGIVAGLCFLKLENSHPDKARNYRIAGLGVLCINIAWGSFALRNSVFNYRVPLTTAGLLLCLHGMRRMAAGEKPNF